MAPNIGCQVPSTDNNNIAMIIQNHFSHDIWFFDGLNFVKMSSKGEKEVNNMFEAMIYLDVNPPILIVIVTKTNRK